MKKKNSFWINPLFALALSAIVLAGCPGPVEEDSVQTNTVKDIDGNNYKTVTIGTQVWLAENLKTNKFNDGTAIPLISDPIAWIGRNTPAYCWYDNNAANKSVYGALYNWHTVNTGKLCPKGWHVPTDSEWTTMSNYLGGESIAGGKLKETGTSHWVSPNSGATNTTGFTALPGGWLGSGSFNGITNYGYWWSSKEDLATGYAWAWHTGYDNIFNYKDFSGKENGLSVRCLRD